MIDPSIHGMNKSMKNDSVCQNAGSEWISYVPVKRDSRVLSISSNHKFFRDKGIDFWVGAASATDSSDSIDKGYVKCGLREPRSNAAQIWATSAEARLCMDIEPMADYILVDGSISSKIHSMKNVFLNSKTCLDFLKYMYDKKNIIFVSRMPTLIPNIHGSNMGAARHCVGIRRFSGFTIAHEDTMYGTDSIISTIYARLENWTPIITMEMFGDDYDEQKIKPILDHLVNEDLTGYPRSLRQVQRMCEITKSNLDRLKYSHRSHKKKNVSRVYV